jgi:leader peptidase (prepilin peptidase) / N-methyltransferase
VGNAIEIGIFVAGIVLGVLINHAIYGLAYFPRAMGAWHRRPAELPPLSKGAWLPIVGWLFRRGESEFWGRGFWIRPMIIECIVPFLLVGLYRAMMNGLTIPTSIRVAAADGTFGPLVTGGGISSWELIAQYVAYSVVFSLLLVATFIDIDERTIPDSITIPGTFLGLFASTWIPGWSLWEVRGATLPALVPVLEPMQAGSPYAWDTQWGQNGLWGIGLWIGLLIWWIWCLSLGNLRWIARRGIKKALVYAWVGFWRSPNLSLVFGMALVGSLLISAGYFGLSAARWQALFSSLMGSGLAGYWFGHFALWLAGYWDKKH